MTTNDILLTEQELAERWRVAKRTVRHWRANQRGPAFIRLGRTQQGRVVYRLADVLAYEAQQRKAEAV